MPHPLESVVWKAFAEQNFHDGSSLAQFLAGARVRSAKAYRTVALDVLGTMEDQGLLERDEQGCWRKVTPTPPRAGDATRHRS